MGKDWEFRRNQPNESVLIRMRPSRRYYLLWLIGGFTQMWLLLLSWGFSNGPTNAVPYVTLVGTVVIAMVSTALAPFFPRVAAMSATIGAALALSWAGLGLRERPLPIGAMAVFGLVPFAIACLSVRYLVRTRHLRWFELVDGGPRWKSFVLVIIPVVVLFGLFNGPLVLLTIFAGP